VPIDARCAYTRALAALEIAGQAGTAPALARRNRRTATAFFRGSVIYFGKYELLSRINIGGMAEIVKARDTTPPGDQLVAIKRILPHLCEDEQFKAMFMDESRVLAQLDHASIIRAFEIGEIEDTPYIALEYVAGQDARALFEETRRTGSRVPIGLACYIIARVCEGLHHAHEQTDANRQLLGIVHRDVSLQNILLSYDGDVKLTDFGIAVSAENEARTEVGVVKGKFGYMSPEQIKGAALDRRSDVFATGICLYELLTGERLFSGESDYKAVERVRNADVQPPSALNRQIPSGLERIVMKALAKQPRDRYQSTNDMRRALQTFMAEVNEFISQEDLAGYIRHTFADELAGLEQPRPTRPSERVTASQPVAHDAVTGLSAFDDLEPVSSLRFSGSDVAAVRQGSGTLPPPASDMPRMAPSVPPLIPRAESIPASAISRSPAVMLPRAARNVDPGWDEEEATTVSPGARAPEHPPVFGEEEVTRRLPGEDTAQGLAALRGEAPAEPANAWAYDAPYVRSVPTLQTQRPAPAISPGLVLGVFAAAALVLAAYLLRDHGVATLRLETDPRDAHVSVDGRSASGPSSPFVFTELAAGTNHDVLVEKSGYSSWSTRLRLRRDKTLELPVIKLEPLQAAPPATVAPELAQPPAAPEPAPPPQAATHSLPPLAAKAPAAVRAAPRERSPAQPRDDADRSKRVVASSKHNPVVESSAPPTHAAPSGMGTLRVNTRPWSQVSIDGKLIGNTPQMNLQLPAGTHTVVLSNPGFGVTKSLVVTIKPDETVTRVITLAP
jgi:eukaryotic-like serine/threonine-protein kinase